MSESDDPALKPVRTLWRAVCIIVFVLLPVVAVPTAILEYLLTRHLIAENAATRGALERMKAELSAESSARQRAQKKADEQTANLMAATSRISALEMQLLAQRTPYPTSESAPTISGTYSETVAPTEATSEVRPEPTSPTQPTPARLGRTSRLAITLSNRTSSIITLRYLSANIGGSTYGLLEPGAPIVIAEPVGELVLYFGCSSHGVQVWQTRVFFRRSSTGPPDEAPAAYAFRTDWSGECELVAEGANEGGSVGMRK